MDKQVGYDVCVSFHNADDEPEYGFAEGWIAAFHQNLIKALSQMLNREPKILLYNQHNQIYLKDIKTTSVLIFILSDNSFNNHECLHTLHTFNQASLEEENNDKLVLKVIKNPVSAGQQPDLLQSVIKFSLHQKIEESITGNTITEEENFSNHQTYWVELVRLASVIQKFLHEQNGEMSDNVGAHYQDNPTIAPPTLNPLPHTKRAGETVPNEIGNNIQQAKNTSNISATESIYLLYDLPDSQAIPAVRNFLHIQGYHVVEPNFTDTLHNRRKLHESNLISAGAVIIYYGNTNKQWLQMKLLDLLKSPGLGRTKPFLGKAIYTTHQNLAVAVEANKYNLTMIEHGEIFPPQTIKDFLKKLKGHDA